jgi:hypothetical protein
MPSDFLGPKLMNRPRLISVLVLKEKCNLLGNIEECYHELAQTARDSFPQLVFDDFFWMHEKEDLLEEMHHATNTESEAYKSNTIDDQLNNWRSLWVQLLCPYGLPHANYFSLLPLRLRIEG